MLCPYINLTPVPLLTDEKERFDPTQFQESIVQGLNQSGTDLEAVAKFLDASGGKLDYRRYAETLFDILVAGGMLGEFKSTDWERFGGPAVAAPMCKDHEQLLPLTTCFYPSRAAPGGTLSDDMTRTEFCLFTAQEDLETMQAYAQVTEAASYHPCTTISRVEYSRLCSHFGLVTS